MIWMMLLLILLAPLELFIQILNSSLPLIKEPFLPPEFLSAYDR
jgi:hypothetical protein